MTLKTPITHGRFLPGSMIANRWRVVALLGEGGMGEVYRADDLKLGEAVALKFLPERLERDPNLRERFLGEARLARQVAHPNVCRVYDVGEIDGRPFLSMEYVDGEDLGTLLRRIGRLPRDKAVQTAREMCAGLAAAHAQGILHRDLKPSNVMLDGRGHARLTDFGLAVAADAAANDGDLLVGTPAYMAPEQLDGAPPSVATDLYSLGLVLYELFTGRHAFEASDAAALAYLKQHATPSPPSQITPDVDPITERAILRCLSPDPAQRPSSAVALAAALPGGDPLAAAVAAGETPSPELVAAGTGEDAIDARRIALLALGFVVALVALFALAPSRQLLQRAPLRKTPEVMMERARTIAERFGYSNRADESGILLYNSALARGLARQFGLRDVGTADRDAFQNAFGMFYRSSPAPMVPYSPNRPYPTNDDPPLERPGMTRMVLDGALRLALFEAVPPLTDAAQPDSTPDWRSVLEFLGFDWATLTADSLRLVPSQPFDRRMAWNAIVPIAGHPERLHIEAAAMHGRIVFMRILPVSDMLRANPFHEPTAVIHMANSVTAAIGLVFVAVILFVALRHIRSGRADVTGAVRVALVATLLSSGADLFVAHRGGGWVTIPPLFVEMMKAAVFTFALAFGIYLAIEPVLRRTWPQVMVSWARAVEGRWNDVRVGRDVLLGLTFGVGLFVALYGLQMLWSIVTGHPVLPGALDSPADQTDTLSGGGWPYGQVLKRCVNGLFEALLVGSGLAVTTVATRSKWAAILAAMFLGLVFAWTPDTLVQPFDAVAIVIRVAVLVAIIVNVGLVAGTAYFVTQEILCVFPLAAPGSSWYWPATAVGVGFLVLVAVLSVRAGLGGKLTVALPDESAPAPRRT
jgi:serine/threonine-protein kinase